MAAASVVYILLLLLVTTEEVYGRKGPCTIDAAVTWPKNDKMYLFKDNRYAVWDETNDELGPWSYISHYWKGIPSHLDAAVDWAGTTHFFKGCHYWRYFNDDTHDGPHDIRKGWRVPCNIDAAVSWKNKKYLFKGDLYWRWYGDKFHGPTKISSGWKGLEGNLDAGVRWFKHLNTYLFKDDKFWKYSHNGDVTVRKINGKTWKGLLDGGLMPNCPCDCSRCCNDNWKFSNVDYDLNNARLIKLPPEVVAWQFVNNRNGSVEAKVSFVAEKTVTETKSFTHTAGVSITAGTTFKAGVPLVTEAEISVSVEASYAFEYGKETSIEKKHSSVFECPGAPGKFTRCKAMLHTDRVEVPYTMFWKHKTKGCKCQEKGIYTGVSSLALNLIIEERNKK